MTMNDPDVTTIVRTIRRRRRVPEGIACVTCDQSRHLRRYADGRVLCYGCRQAERGARPTVADHVAGEENLGGLTVALLANDHPTVTELRLRLGLDAWPPAAGDPLLVLAHLLAGLGTLLTQNGGRGRSPAGADRQLRTCLSATPSSPSGGGRWDPVKLPPPRRAHTLRPAPTQRECSALAEQMRGGMASSHMEGTAEQGCVSARRRPRGL